MALYRFVGDVSLVHFDGEDIDLKHFGQQVTLTDEQAKLALSFRVPLIQDADFWGCGFTEEEVKEYPTANDQRSASKTFLDKKQKSVEIFIYNLTSQNKPATGGFGN